MKRLGNLYENIYDLDNIEKAYKEVCKNTRNERKVFNMKQYKAIYISRIYRFFFFYILGKCVKKIFIFIY